MSYIPFAKVDLDGPMGSNKTKIVEQLVPQLDDAG